MPTPNYALCASQPVCNCPELATTIESPAHNEEIGFGTAACVWETLFGHSLTPLADGTRQGFIKTCCSIHQGHYPCGNQWQYGNRERYWNAANSLATPNPNPNPNPTPTPNPTPNSNPYQP